MTYPIRMGPDPMLHFFLIRRKFEHGHRVGHETPQAKIWGSLSSTIQESKDLYPWIEAAEAAWTTEAGRKFGLVTCMALVKES